MKLKIKKQLQRFLGCLNYVADLIPNIRTICAPLYKRLRKNPSLWNANMTQVIIKILQIIKHVPCLGIRDPEASLIVETDCMEES